MSEPTCPDCAGRDAVIAALPGRVGELEGQVNDLRARLGQDSSNSSVPPSANPPGAPKPPPRKPSGRRSGGQPGHPATSAGACPASASATSSS